jgi:hypothetical protein
MPQYDLRLDIPARAIMNDNIRHRMELGASFLQAKQEYFAEPWAVKAGIDPLAYTLDDQVRAISLLYCVIVVPRELLSLSQDHQLYQELDRLGVASYFRVKRPNPIDSFRLVTSLRHAVSHGLFSIEQVAGQINYTFWTERDPRFKAEITQSQLMAFLNACGVRFTDQVLRLKTKNPHSETDR